MTVPQNDIFNHYWVLQMHSRDKILQYYYSGRFECDLEFYQSLQRVARELELYQWSPELEKQGGLIASIQTLTERNSRNADEDLEDQELISELMRIKRMLGDISTSSVHQVIRECEQTKWEPYSLKAARKMQGKVEYQSILQRLNSSIHGQQLKSDSILFSALFSEVNPKPSEVLPIYNAVIEVLSVHLQSILPKVKTINEADRYSNICNLVRVRTYVCSLYFLLRLAQRFCEILRVLAGKSNLALKFAYVKKEVLGIIAAHPEWGVKEEKENIFGLLPAYKEHLKETKILQLSKVCKWCFKALTKQVEHHSFCQYVIEHYKDFSNIQ